MKKALLLSILAASTMYAGNLAVSHGTVKAHTEALTDGQINPATSGLTSHLTMNGDPTTIKGSIDVSIKSLKSDNDGRDEHMHEAINSSGFPVATYTVSSVAKAGNGYKMNGTLKFHGVSKPLAINADIKQSGKKVSIKGNASFKMSSYGVTPPKLLLITVRDQVDLSINVDFTDK